MKRLSLGLLLVVLSWSHCGNSQQQDSSAFEYREVYLPQLPSDEARKINLNSVDRDWGIWGHNLSVVLPKNPSPSVYAKNGNSINKDQFCFSSDILFDYIKDYIDNNYGSDIPMRFAVLPNDNPVVCQCAECTEHGNSKGDASGAVYYLLERLTSEYPKHQFFTSYYRTAKGLPRRPLPDNAGVLISAIDYPLCTAATPQENDFKRLLSQWSGLTKHIYVWDYINNFDDYFTPFPVFDVVQRRLQIYADNGVTGVFFNGSGPDYSTMSRIKTHIIAALMDDPALDWRPMLKDLCSRMYPVTGDMISRFMIRQEDMIRDNGKPLPLYEGIVRETATYLPVKDFVDFHSEVINMLPHIKDPEFTEIQQMSRALMLTHLELMRISADTLGARRMLAGLDRLVRQGVNTYSEAGGSTESYISEYRYMLRHLDETGRRNLLRGVHIEPLTALDEDYQDISILTDGMLGLPSSYHCGQMLSSADPSLKLAIPNVKGIKRLRVYMTRNAIYHIALPLSVSLSVDGQEVSRQVPKPMSGNNQRAMVEFGIPSGSKGSLILTVVRNKDERTMALDEIEGFR